MLEKKVNSPYSNYLQAWWYLPPEPGTTSFACPRIPVEQKGTAVSHVFEVSFPTTVGRIQAMAQDACYTYTHHVRIDCRKREKIGDLHIPEISGSAKQISHGNFRWVWNDNLIALPFFRTRFGAGWNGENWTYHDVHRMRENPIRRWAWKIPIKTVCTKHSARMFGRNRWTEQQLTSAYTWTMESNCSGDVDVSWHANWVRTIPSQSHTEASLELKTMHCGFDFLKPRTLRS